MDLNKEHASVYVRHNTGGRLFHRPSLAADVSLNVNSRGESTQLWCCEMQRPRVVLTSRRRLSPLV